MTESYPDGPDLALLAHRLTSALQRALRAAQADDGDSQIGPRHHAVLTCLSPTGSRAVDLARQTGQHKQVVGTLIDDMEKAGYVRREPDPVDRRGKLIVPTDLGRQQMARTHQLLDSIEKDITADLGAQRYREFKQACERVVQVLTEERPTHGPRPGAARPLSG